MPEPDRAHVATAAEATQPARQPDAVRCLFLIEPSTAPSTVMRDPISVDAASGNATGDLYLELEQRPDGLTGRLHYNIELFKPAMVHRLIGSFTTLLEGIVADPDCLLCALPLLEEVESLPIRPEWNGMAQFLPGITLHAGFEAQAVRTPQAPAVEFDGQIWPYGELNRRADQLAARLAAAGAGPGTLTALYMERSPDMVAGLLAILKTGSAYLPLDPAFPIGRLALITSDAGPEVLLTQRSLQTSTPATDARIVCLEDDDPVQNVPTEVRPVVDAEALAYVLYTSGSTGRPKGVEVPHRAVMNLLASMRHEPGFQATDTLLAVTTIAFDIAVLELFLPLLSGGRVVLASREVTADPRRLADLMRHSRCSVMQATPATWRGLIEAGWGGDDGLRILCGGEAMSRNLADKLLTRCGALWNMYGPTETTVWSTIHRVRPGETSVPIGQPIGNTRTYIVDSSDGLVPTGVAGELLIGGAGVAHGYRRNPILTAERFITSPFSPKERVYRTGDLARYCPNGAIEWLGRADSQIKIRGFRIEVQEIEAALEGYPDVLSAAVKAWPDASGHPILAAYFVTTADGPIDLAALRLFLRGLLPDYMMPGRFVALGELPLTPNGKLDRNALPRPGVLIGGSASGALAEARECKLAALWEELLDVRNLGPDDNFFDLGGDSLRAVSLLVAIEQQFDRRLTLAALFQTPTIASMAALLGEKEAEMRLPLAAEIQPQGSRPTLFWIDGGPMFLPLANAMGLEQPFLGVTLNPTELGETGFQPDLETIARHLVRTIRTIQPDGPFLIGGYCAGGVLAYEVASQLVAAGHPVPLLCLIDAQNPVDFQRVGSLTVELAKLRHHLAAAMQASPARRWDYIVEHASSAYRRILSRSPWHSVMKSEPFTLGEIMQPAADAYRPGIYKGKVALFQAKRPKQLDLRHGWAKVVVGELVSYEFAGAHSTMLEHPQVSELARLMNGCLDQVQAVSQSPPVA